MACSMVLERLMLPLILFGVFLGSVDAAAVHEGDGQWRSASGHLLVLSDSTVEERKRTRTKLGIELDLSIAVKARAWQPNEDCATNGAKSFEEALQSADLAKELTSEERSSFKDRFVQQMLADCKYNPNIATAWAEKVAEGVEKQKPVATEASVASINQANLGFTVSTKWMKHLTTSQYQDLAGYLAPEDSEFSNDTSLLSAEAFEKEQVPSSMDPVAKWPNCRETLLTVHNQGTCGSCWAFGTGSAMDARMCIASNGAFGGSRGFLSKGYLASCAQTRDGCQGGYWQPVFDLLSGKVSGKGAGSVLGTDKGCIPYFGHGAGEDHFNSKSKAPRCQQDCASVSGQSYHRSFQEDLYPFPPGWAGQASASQRSGGSLSADVLRKARQTMYEDGPLPFAIGCDGAFKSYKNGIWDGNCQGRGNHLVSGIGYGEGYFQLMNSWGARWGDNGQFKMKDCGAEAIAFPAKIGDFKSQWPSVPGASPGPAPGPPAPGPSPPGPAPPTPAPYPVQPAWAVSSGDCTIDGGGCLRSPNYKSGSENQDGDECDAKEGKYDPDQACTIDLLDPDSVSPAIKVVAFDTERNFDYLTVNGVKFSGSGDDIDSKDPSQRLHDMIPDGQMKWVSDKGFQRYGFKLCPVDPRKQMAYVGSFTDPRDDDNEADDDADYVHHLYARSAKLGPISPWPGMELVGNFTAKDGDGNDGDNYNTYVCSGKGCGPPPAPTPAPTPAPPQPSPGPSPTPPRPSPSPSPDNDDSPAPSGDCTWTPVSKFASGDYVGDTTFVEGAERAKAMCIEAGPECKTVLCLKGNGYCCLINALPSGGYAEWESHVPSSGCFQTSEVAKAHTMTSSPAEPLNADAVQKIMEAVKAAKSH